MKLVECVPNISEGRDQAVLDAVAEAVKSVSGVRLLDVDPGKATHRTVYTFAGEPEAVLEAAFRLIEKSYQLIDMRKHKGAHARQGAVDVCPFVPISETTLGECVALSQRLAKRVGSELDLPVYLYGAAAKKPERKRLPDIRHGEYEALEGKLKSPEWAPDYGPARFVPEFGVLTTGARDFLIAYNVNLNSRSVPLAKKIAFEVREAGKNKRGPDGKFVRDSDGVPIKVPGMFKSVQGTGWLIPEYGRAQVTVNILDLEAAPVHKLFDACCELAASSGARVTGSEVVGMLPERVLLDAGRYFLEKQGSSTGVSREELVRVGVQSLGLSDVSEFDPKKKVIEERFRDQRRLVSMTLQGFCEETASDAPAPGGGSVAALAGALSASLSAMVAQLTHGKKKYQEHDAAMARLGEQAHALKEAQLAAIDEDTEAFERVMEAFGVPKGPERDRAVSEANKGAALVPLETLERTLPSLDLSLEAAEKGNANSLSDAGVAALCARAAAVGAYYNVLINLGGVDDEGWVLKTRKTADSFLAEAEAKASKIDALMRDRLG